MFSGNFRVKYLRYQKFNFKKKVVEKMSHSKRRPRRELGLIEKNKLELLALE